MVVYTSKFALNTVFQTILNGRANSLDFAVKKFFLAHFESKSKLFSLSKTNFQAKLICINFFQSTEYRFSKPILDIQTNSFFLLDNTSFS